MKREAAQIRTWLAKHPADRKGPTGGLRKSNLTNNESAKLATDKGVPTRQQNAAEPPAGTTDAPSPPLTWGQRRVTYH